MADLIIRGMEIPKGCEDCKLRYRHQGAYCVDYCFPLHKTVDPWTFGQDRNGDKPDWCPLLPLPPHGRLIDADEIVAEMEKKGTELDKIMELCKRVGDMENYFRCSNNQTEIVTFVRMLKNAPTIVPAEGGGDGK